MNSFITTREASRSGPGFRAGVGALTLLAAVSLGPALHPGLVAGQEPVDSALTRLRDAYVAAYNAGDAAAMAPFYTPDAVRMPYDAPAQEGREAILAYYRASFARRRFDPTLQLIPAAILTEGDLAVERGAYVEVQKPRNGGAQRLERGKYVAVLHRDGRGVWRFSWSIFNRDALPTPSGTPPHGG